MSEVINFLNENAVVYFATIGLDGKPKARPFQFMLEKGGKLFFCTANEKNVFKELQKNPYVEITTSSPKFAWIRLSGKVKFSNDLDVKKTILDNNELVRSLYKTPENPVFEVFYLEEAKAVIADFSGEPAKEYNL